MPSDGQLRIGVKHKVECARKTRPGDHLSMQYTGWTRADGHVFDSSVTRNQPFDFTLGQGMVIKGWDQGLLNMCVGERRRLTIPSDMGYGDRGQGADIPGGATLVFDVELLSVRPRRPRRLAAGGAPARGAASAPHP